MFEIERLDHIAVLSNGKERGTLELNYVCINGRYNVYEIGKYDENGQRKFGVTLNYEQIEELKKIICDL